jgi:hypothetical protein
MFKNAGSGLRISCDSGERVLRIQENAVSGLAYLKPMWKEVATFSSSAQWQTSSYFNRVTDEGVKDEIIYFWFDMEAEPINAPGHYPGAFRIYASTIIHRNLIEWRH